MRSRRSRARSGSTSQQPGREPQTWEKVVRKLRTGMMPPAGAPRPERAALDRSPRSWKTRSIAPPPPLRTRAHPALHRLNRTEYANAVRDLLDLPVDATALLPGDDSSEGFDNIASVLSVSPALMQAYVSAAAKISRLAIGDPTISSGITTYRRAARAGADRRTATACRSARAAACSSSTCSRSTPSTSSESAGRAPDSGCRRSAATSRSRSRWTAHG